MSIVCTQYNLANFSSMMSCSIWCKTSLLDIAYTYLNNTWYTWGNTVLQQNNVCNVEKHPSFSVANLLPMNINFVFWCSVQTQTVCVPLAPARTHSLGRSMTNVEKPSFLPGCWALNFSYASLMLHRINLFWWCSFLPTDTQSLFSWHCSAYFITCIEVLLKLHCFIRNTLSNLCVWGWKNALLINKIIRTSGHTLEVSNSFITLGTDQLFGSTVGI